MFLVLSGEGASDIGTQLEVGPMTKLLDRLIEKRLGYSIIESAGFVIFSEAELGARSKQLRSLSLKGKRQPIETRYFYENARALARLAMELNKENVIAVLFRDADGTVSSERTLWQDKMQSILDGFQVEQFSTGVPMVPKPKSEAWVLCALRDGYQYCHPLEDESGNDRSPNSLKSQLKEHLGESPTTDFLNEKIDTGELDIDRIDMPSANAFKTRLNNVLTDLGLPISK
jgi:hypothetical protein